MKSKVKVSYEYKNRESGSTKLWLAWPQSTRVEDFNTTRPPSKLTTIVDQEIAYFELEEGESVQLSYSVGKYAGDRCLLTQEARSFYLRSTRLSPITDDMRVLAQEITAGSRTEQESAKLLFYYLIDHFQYVYPPKSRGSQDFLLERKGDCGEYSFLYTALCRALDIPCRTVVGSWAVGKMQAHVWNEVYIEGTGWVPVDCSMAYIQKKKKWQFLFSDIKTLPWRKYFGSTEGQRIIFSYDAEIPLEPAYEEQEDERLQTSFFSIDGKPFNWGYQILEGAAPYMQPAYPKFNEKNLEDKTEKTDVRSYLGEWQAKETGIRRVAFLLKKICIPIVLITVILGLLMDQKMLDVVQNLALFLAAGSFVARGERPLLYGVFMVLFLLGLLSVISG